ncbi:MAG: hypothetical protein ACRDLT_08155 [Solirubrobacteraceae bacterium]
MRVGRSAYDQAVGSPQPSPPPPTGSPDSPVQQNAGLVDEIEAAACDYLRSKMRPDASSELAAMGLRQLLGIYWTWRERFPESRPRTAHRSAELARSGKSLDYAAELAELIRKIEAGENLTAHLSTRVDFDFISGQERQSLRPAQRDADHDRMLAAWGIHHLHLSSEPGPGTFNKRGSDLLYVIFRSDDAYLLGIYTHSDWTRRELVEVAVSNWPDAGLFLGSNYALGVTTHFTDGDRRKLRAHGVNDFVEIDGVVWMPASIGVTAAGTSMTAARRAMAYMEELRQLRAHIDANLIDWGKRLDQAAGDPVTGPWTVQVTDGHVRLLRGTDEDWVGLAFLDIE